MTPFTYQRPGSLSEAVSTLSAGGMVIAGGQSLLLALKEREARPSSLVSIGKLAALRGASHGPDGRLRIGAATTYAVVADTDFTGWHQTLAAVAGNLADRSVRNIGTIGGGVCQADPRYDMPTYLSAVSASFELVSTKGERLLSAGEFFNPGGGTHIAADEILAGIFLPPLNTWSTVTFEKFRFRTFEAATGLGGGAVKFGPAGHIEALRIAIGAVAKSPSIPANAIAFMVGKTFSDFDLNVMANAISNEVLPPTSAITRREKYLAELTITLAHRVLKNLAEGFRT